jgi:hypothetical protein
MSRDYWFYFLVFFLVTMTTLTFYSLDIDDRSQVYDIFRHDFSTGPKR